MELSSTDFINITDASKNGRIGQILIEDGGIEQAARFYAENLAMWTGLDWWDNDRAYCNFVSLKIIGFWEKITVDQFLEMHGQQIRPEIHEALRRWFSTGQFP